MHANPDCLKWFRVNSNYESKRNYGVARITESCEHVLFERDLTMLDAHTRLS